MAIENIMTDSSEFANNPEFASNSEPAFEPEIGGEGWSGSDIEEAYLKALNAMEDIPWEEGVTAEEISASDGNLEALAAPCSGVDAVAN